VILRLVRGRVLTGRFDQLREGIASLFAPWVGSAEGLVEAHVGVNRTADGDDVAFVSAWTSPDAAMAALGRSLNRVRPWPGVTEHLEVRSVDHYEVDEHRHSASAERPTIARIAAGLVEQGSDVEIQRELRDRLATLGSEVHGAYVGRRLRGSTVEVLLLTTWSRRPADTSLDTPLFPDLAGRYESFWIETFEIIDPE
jgi:hypothetical protein